MSISAHTIYRMLSELWSTQPLRVSMAKVDYYAVTSTGSRGRFKQQFSLASMNYAQSETAVLYHLKKRHPKCEIIIQSLEFK